MIGPRLLKIVFDCEPMPEGVVQERLKSVSPFVKVTPAEPPYRWMVQLSLHPVVQDRRAKEYVEEVGRKLRLPSPVQLAWHDSSEDGAMQ